MQNNQATITTEIKMLNHSSIVRSRSIRGSQSSVFTPLFPHILPVHEHPLVELLFPCEGGTVLSTV
jgi:hypothetical protein